MQDAGGQVEKAPSGWRVGMGPAACVCSGGRTNAPSEWRVGSGGDREAVRPGLGPQEALCSCSETHGDRLAFTVALASAW